MTAPTKFDAVCFDCDSTLSRLEGIDELAVRAGCVSEVEPLTAAAMDGTLSIEQVYARRIALIRPDRAAIDWVGERYIADLVPGARETIAMLQRLGKSVHVVSGGLLQPVRHLALALGVPSANVHAVEVTFDANGAYRGFDETSPLTTANGKATVVREIAARFGRTALVGDGVTDLRAREGGAFVVGFGGVAARPAVIAGADAFVHGPSLLDVLPALLTPEELALAHTS